MTRRTLFESFFVATILVMLVGVANILGGHTDAWLVTVTGGSFAAAMGNLILLSTVEGLL
jgi:hypothetical protein